jgi:hypothetical protein
MAPETAMGCDAVSERLPWLLNGSLAGAEAEEVRRHLAACPRCGAEMDETRQAAAVYGAHLAAAVLMDLAWDRALPEEDAAVARRHLDGCADCAEELALARESRRLEALPETTAGRGRGWWPAIALPATLAAGLVLGMTWQASRGAPASPPPPGGGRVARLEADVARLGGLVAALEQAARAPRLNLPLFELLPAARVRGGAPDAQDVVVPPGAREIGLLLGADAPAGTRAALHIRGDKGEVWRGEGLVSGPPGGYVVTLPAELLADGTYVLTLTPQAGAPAAFTMRVRRAR